MREESHLDDMRAAVRGDFERLARRRGEQVLLRVAEPPPATDDDATGHVPDAEVVTTEPEPALEPSEPRRSWLARFLSP